MSDNGTATATVTAPRLAGELTIDAAGMVTIAAARPAGRYIVTINAVDNCQAASKTDFALTVASPRRRAVR